MNRKKALELLSLPLEELIRAANETRRRCTGTSMDICGVINAKSGSCSEDCKFCAQSSHSQADIECYPLRTAREILDGARRARNNGAARFGIVTSGNRLSRKEVETIAGAIEGFGEIGILPCASLGALDEEFLDLLKEAGLTRYHHNIETSERFYPEIVSTHDHSERIDTIKAAAGSGLEVCSGVILGMGETWEDRVDMALMLKELNVHSVPMNFLIPIKGTFLENFPVIKPSEAIKAIALFRIILEDVSIKIAAGRETILRDFQAMLYQAGANGMMVGGYLTIPGRSVDDDTALIGEVGKLWSR